MKSTITVGRENSTDIDIYFEDHGEGRPVVLIHGWPLNGHSWEKQTAALLKEGYRVITYDRRGFGQSSQPSTGYDYDTLAADLHQLIATLDLRDAAIFGFSMGGGEVARYLGTYGSERVSQAGFLAAIPPFLLKTDNNPEGVDKSLFDGFLRDIAADRPAFIAGFLQAFYNVDILGGKLISDHAVQASWNVAMQSSAKACSDCIRAWLTDFRSDLAKIDVPTLVMHGSADRTCPFEPTGKRTHEMVRGSKLVLIEDGPHGFIWTHAEEANKALLAFLADRV
ncbi:MAG TPA: alpha/beta hydrolase [Terrimicrobiaceae bacterium]